MESKEVLKILKNIYGSLTYDDWIHAKEYVKIQIDKMEMERKKKKENNHND